MLRELIIENFKSHIKKKTIKLGRITVLIGSNNSGKSSILQALVLLAKSLENSRVFRPTNDIIDLGEYGDIVSNNDEERSITIGISGNEIVNIGEIYDNDQHIKSESADYGFKITANRNDLNEINFYVKSDHSNVKFRWIPAGSDGTIGRPYERREIKINLNGLNGYIPTLTLPESSVLAQEFAKQFQGDFLNNIFKKIYYVPFQRTVGKVGVDITGKKDVEHIVTRNPETTSSNLLSTLGKNKQLQQKVSKLYESIYQSTMSSHNLDPDFRDQEKRNVERISLIFSNNISSSSIANLGTGINQLILLFTILVGSPRNSVICLEEPEIHLHPEKQSSLMKEVLKIIMDDDKQIILTTHSEYILYPLLAAVSKGILQPEQLAVYHVSQDDSGESNVECLDVNNYGQLKGGLKGFWDATTLAMSDFVREKNE